MATVDLSGPFFDDRYDAAAARMTVHAEDDIATHGADIVRDVLGTSIRIDGPGYAARHVTTTRSGGREITDNNATYGPWLEGIGSRNAPKTRFPGYHAFRRSVQRIEEHAAEYAAEAVNTFVREVS